MLRHRKKHNNVNNFDSNDINNASDDDVDKFPKTEEVQKVKGEKLEESDGGGSDLISNLLGIGDRAFIDKVLTASADDAAKLLGVKNGVRE